MSRREGRRRGETRTNILATGHWLLGQLSLPHNTTQHARTHSLTLTSSQPSHTPFSTFLSHHTTAFGPTLPSTTDQRGEIGVNRGVTMPYVILPSKGDGWLPHVVRRQNVRWIFFPLSLPWATTSKYVHYFFSTNMSGLESVQDVDEWITLVPISIFIHLTYYSTVSELREG